jgi:ABC-type glycerol-3-phosphate transport system substrate-binding protein
MGQTFSVFFYRSDLVKPEEVPKTLAELVETSKKLQAANKVKFGYVGGMAMNHSWFSWFWSMWANNCDVLAPPYERDNAKLAANGWKSMMTEPCMKETVEYWWDAINTHKISPRGMPAYDRNEANAIFMGGDAAFTVADSLWWGTFNDPAKSKMAARSPPPASRSARTARSRSRGTTSGAGRSRSRSRRSARRSPRRCWPP